LLPWLATWRALMQVVPAQVLALVCTQNRSPVLARPTQVRRMHR
jgi:hypothetical protein